MGGGQDTGCSPLGLHVKDLPKAVYVEGPNENELPIIIKVEFDNKAERGKVSGKIQLNFDLGILTKTEFEINNVTKEVKRRLTDEFLKLALKEIGRMCGVMKTTFSNERYFVTSVIKEDEKIIIIHPKGYAEELRKQPFR